MFLWTWKIENPSGELMLKVKPSNKLQMCMSILESGPRLLRTASLRTPPPPSHFQCRFIAFDAGVRSARLHAGGVMRCVPVQVVGSACARSDDAAPLGQCSGATLDASRVNPA